MTLTDHADKPQVQHSEYSGIVTTGLKSHPVTEVETTDIKVQIAKADKVGVSLGPDGGKAPTSVSNVPYVRDVKTPVVKSRVTTPSILTDEFIGTDDYFSLVPDDHANGESEVDDLDDECGIDEDLADPTEIAVQEDKTLRTVKIKYQEPERNGTLVMSDQVCVVGSFDQWRNSVPLEPSFQADGTLFFKTSLFLPIGIYRIKFLVNGKTRHSDSLPTATDKSGNIVNWFEVGTKESPTVEVEAGALEKHQIINHIRKSTPSILKQQQREAGRYSDATLPNAADSRIHSRTGTPVTPEFTQAQTQQGDQKRRGSREQFTQDVPPIFQTFLNETDELSPMEEEFMQKHPIPELPVYLNNNYLNKHFTQHHNQSSDIANLSMKGTNMQGLNSHIIPHVNLKHLLTSNIKNGVLGVACTTRYSGKFVTQIMYSPSD